MPSGSVMLGLALVVLVTLGHMGVEAVPAAYTQREFVKAPDRLPVLQEVSEVTAAVTDAVTGGLGQTTRPSSGERTTGKTAERMARTALLDRRSRARTGPVTSGPGRRAQMLKMLAVLEEASRTMDSTRNARITIVPRANGKKSGKKSKTAPAVGSPRLTTVPPVDLEGTASRASTNQIDVSSLTGRAFKKSVPPQPKKPNKRVCFWKYCSQN